MITSVFVFASIFWQLWLKPEGKQLCSAFQKLKKLSLRGIFVEFDLLWTIVLLEAAPSVEIFDIEVLLCFSFHHFFIERVTLLYKPTPALLGLKGFVVVVVPCFIR
jgi:hypothetical protein